MKAAVLRLRWGLLLLAVLAAVAGGGCATTESENAAETPWNRPQGWETGLPGGMYNPYPR